MGPAGTQGRAPGAPDARILERVRKLRALTNSPNVHEAAAAAAAVERILQEHSLSDAETAISDEALNEPADGGVFETAHKTVRWREFLFGRLAEQYQCSAWFEKKMERQYDPLGAFCHARTAEVIYRATGRPADLETLRYQFAFFTLEISRLCEVEGRGKGRGWRNSFAWGAAEGILAALRAASAEVRERASYVGIVRVDARAQAARGLRDDLTAGQLTSQRQGRDRVEDDATDRGRRAGANINQRSAITADGVRMLPSGKVVSR